MTDEEIRQVFDELRRVGADLGRPPGLAIGTGFGAGELRPWLRALPDGVGHDAFASRLAAHVNAAAPPPSPETIPPRGDPRAARSRAKRFWPTREQSDLAIDVLVSEWDPLGARLGVLTREDVEQFAFSLVGGLNAYASPWHGEMAGALEIGTMEADVFGVRPSPIEQRRYLARRLCEIVASHPAPESGSFLEAFAAARSETAGPAVATARVRRMVPRGFEAVVPGSSSRVSLGPTGYEPAALDPAGVCAVCGTTGTVAFVTREREPRVSQFCRDCWRGSVRSWAWDSPRLSQVESVDELFQMFEHVDRMRKEDIRSAGSALWEDRFGLIEEMVNQDERHARDADAPSAGGPRVGRGATIRQWVEQLVADAPNMDGPMPEHVAAFVGQYTTPDA